MANNNLYLVNLYLSHFSITQKEKEESYSVDHNSSLYDFIREVIHEGRWPDNFKYRCVYRALEDLSQQMPENFDVPCLDPDIYYSEQDAWASRSASQEYLNQVLEEQTDFGLVRDYYSLIRVAQQKELDEISYRVFQFIEEEVEKLNREQDLEWEA